MSFDGTEGKKGNKTWRIKKNGIKFQAKSKLSCILPKKQSAFYYRTNYKLAQLLPALWSQPMVEYKNVIHSRQVISPSSTPPLYFGTFSGALQNNWREGREARMWVWGFIQLGGEGGEHCGFFLLLKRNCFTPIYLMKEQCLATKEKQKHKY